tara:strand:+ start:1033 stop:1224 length:192 start_codon:yes stop_codon:yes gene_type:complete
MDNNLPKKRNIWHLVLGLIFLVYGCYKLYILNTATEDSTLGIILAIGFIAFGIYDLYKYYKGI